MQAVHERWFDLQRPKDGAVSVDNVSAALSGFHIAGPQARALLQRLTPVDVSGEALPFLGNRLLDLEGCPEAIVIRISFTGELGYELHFTNSYQEPFLERLMAAGDDLGLRLAGMRALMWLRLEKGFPSWGSELSADYSPLEPGLGRYVKPNKGDFIGRDAYDRTREAGPRELLATLVVDADGADCWGGESIYRDGEHVGYVTSGGFGPCVGESLALGYVRASAFNEGAPMEVLVQGERRPAFATMRPRFDPAGTRMRA